MPAIESSDHFLKSASRSSGTLSALAMTSTGSGTANCDTNSIEPDSIHESMRRVAIARIVGSSEAITFGVNALVTSRRYRVWSGGSAVSIVGTRG